MSLISNLPEALCLELLSSWCVVYDVMKLDNACAISKNNNSSLYLKELYRQPFLSMFNCAKNIQENERNLFWACKRGICLTSFNLTNKIMLSKSYLTDLNTSRTCGISIQNCDLGFINSEALVPVVAALNRAYKLEALNVSVLCHVWDNAIAKLNPEILNNLKVIIVISCVVNDKLQTFAAIAKHCSNLSLLCFRLPIPEENELLVTVTERDMVEVFTHCVNLRTIMAKNCCITDKVAQVISKCIPDLMVLEMHGCINIHFTTITDIIINCKHMSGFMSDDTNNNFVGYNLKNGEKEVWLFLREHYEAETYLRFFRHITHITKLSMNNLFSLDDDLVQLILQNNPTLHSVMTNETNSLNSAAGLRQLLTSSTTLTSLKLKYCNGLSNQELISIFSIPNKLTALSLCYHNTIDSATLITILRTNPAIRHLKLHKNFMMESVRGEFYILRLFLINRLPPVSLLYRDEEEDSDSDWELDVAEGEAILGAHDAAVAAVVDVATETLQDGEDEEEEVFHEEFLNRSEDEDDGGSDVWQQVASLVEPVLTAAVDRSQHLEPKLLGEEA